MPSFRNRRGNLDLSIVEMRNDARDFGTSFYGAHAQDIRIEPNRGNVINAAGPRDGRVGPGTPQITPVPPTSAVLRSPMVWLAVVAALFLIEV